MAGVKNCHCHVAACSDRLDFSFNVDLSQDMISRRQRMGGNARRYIYNIFPRRQPERFDVELVSTRTNAEPDSSAKQSANLHH